MEVRDRGRTEEWRGKMHKNDVEEEQDGGEGRDEVVERYRGQKLSRTDEKRGMWEKNGGDG